jgi:hypothetical protein
MNLGVATSIPFERKFDFLFSPHTFQKSQSSTSIKRWRIEKSEKKKYRKKRKREKSSKSLSHLKKGEFNILRGENIFNTFPCEPIFSRSILPLQKPFSKSFENS